MHWARSVIFVGGVTRFELIFWPVSWPSREISREAVWDPHLKLKDFAHYGGRGGAAAEGPGNDVDEDERATMQ